MLISGYVGQIDEVIQKRRAMTTGRASVLRLVHGPSWPGALGPASGGAMGWSPAT